MKTLIYWTNSNRKGYPPPAPTRFRLVVDPAALVNQGDPGFDASKRTPPGVEVESTDGNGDLCWVHARDARPADEILRRAMAKIAGSTGYAKFVIDGTDCLGVKAGYNGQAMIIDLGVLP